MLGGVWPRTGSPASAGRAQAGECFWTWGVASRGSWPGNLGRVRQGAKSDFLPGGPAVCLRGVPGRIPVCSLTLRLESGRSLLPASHFRPLSAALSRCLQGGWAPPPCGFPRLHARGSVESDSDSGNHRLGPPGGGTSPPEVHVPNPLRQAVPRGGPHLFLIPVYMPVWTLDWPPATIPTLLPGYYGDPTGSQTCSLRPPPTSRFGDRALQARCTPKAGPSMASRCEGCGVLAVGVVDNAHSPLA